MSFKAHKWYCGNGHLFTFGDEQWHEEVSQGSDTFGDDEEILIPMYCMYNYPNGEPCLDSSSLILED
jgi:hypothetical protein